MIQLIIWICIFFLFQGAEGATCQWGHRKPDPNDCGSYLECVHGVYIQRSCPAGLHYDPDHDVCNWPQLVNCQVHCSFDDLLLRFWSYKRLGSFYCFNLVYLRYFSFYDLRMIFFCFCCRIIWYQDKAIRSVFCIVLFWAKLLFFLIIVTFVFLSGISGNVVYFYLW